MCGSAGELDRHRQRRTQEACAAERVLPVRMHDDGIAGKPGVPVKAPTVTDKSTVPFSQAEAPWRSQACSGRQLLLEAVLAQSEIELCAREPEASGR